MKKSVTAIGAVFILCMSALGDEDLFFAGDNAVPPYASQNFGKEFSISHPCQMDKPIHSQGRDALVLIPESDSIRNYAQGGMDDGNWDVSISDAGDGNITGNAADFFTRASVSKAPVNTQLKAEAIKMLQNVDFFRFELDMAEISNNDGILTGL